MTELERHAFNDGQEVSRSSVFLTGRAGDGWL